MFSRHW